MQGVNLSVFVVHKKKEEKEEKRKKKKRVHQDVSIYVRFGHCIYNEYLMVW